MRLFVAAELSAEVRGRAAAAVREVLAAMPARAGAAPVPAARIHLTLAFLGEVGDGRLADVSSALAAVPRLPAFAAAAAGAGAFPSPVRARVLWAGVGAGARELRTLAAGVGGALRRMGGTELDREQRAFVPHVTLCRFRAPVRLDSLAVFERMQDTEWGRCPIQRFVLFESRQTAAGRAHVPRAVFDLPSR